MRSYQSTGRTGVQFQNLEPRDVATLRHIITTFLSGEMINVGGVLSTLQRDNFTKARKQKDSGSGLSAFGRLRAVTVSLGVFVVGVAAFGFIAKSLYGMYFVSHAEAGVVSVPTTNVTMPRDGSVQSLVENGAQVVRARRWQASAPACSICSKAIWTTRSSSPPRSRSCSASSSPARSPAHATASSPASWWMTASTPARASRSSNWCHAPPTRWSRRASAIASSTSQARHPRAVPVAGEDEMRTGKIISSASLNSEDLASDIRVQIKPDSGLPAELAGRPAAVNADRGPSLDWLIDKAVARGL